MDGMLEYNPVFTQLYVTSFMALTLVCAMALVIAILNSTYQDLKKQANYYSNMDLKDYEMIEFTIRRFKRWLGLTKEKPVSEKNAFSS